ncbi:MAG: ABC transporter permease [Nitrospinota bacterium]
MGTKLLKRFVHMLGVLVILSIVLYYMLGLMPGDPVDLLITSRPNITAEDIANLRRLYGLDQPIYVRYLKWVRQVLSGDLGFSRTYKRPTGEILSSRIGNTFWLMAAAFLISLVVAVPLGIFSALRQYSGFDYAVNLGAFTGISVPAFWLGLMAIILFAEVLGWFPPGGIRTLGRHSLGDRLWHLTLPALVLSIQTLGQWTRYMRNSMFDTLKTDYIRTARAKGLGETAVIGRHALKNAAFPMITVLALSIPELFSGALITETIFAWPGMGRLLYDSVIGSDYYVAMIAFMCLAALTLLFNMMADIAYGVADPRLRRESIA